MIIDCGPPIWSGEAWRYGALMWRCILIVNTHHGYGDLAIFLGIYRSIGIDSRTSAYGPKGPKDWILYPRHRMGSLDRKKKETQEG